MPVVSLKELKSLIPTGKRVMGIDQSAKILGLALADPDFTLATPLTTIHRTKFKNDVQELAKICRDYEVGGFVIGYPLNMDGSAGPRIDSVKHFAQNLIGAAHILGFAPYIAFQDERLSTHNAEQILIEDLNMPRTRRGEVIDMMAATQILQAALDTISD